MNSLRSYLDRLADDLPDFAERGPISPHTRGIFGDTPLHVAAVRGELDALEWLLDAGVDINAAGEHGYTALHEAVEQSQEGAVRLLLERGASSSIPNDEGCIPLELARLHNNERIATILLNHAA